VRCLITGVDDAGRSCVVDEREVSFAERAPGLWLDGLFKTSASLLATRPPVGGPRVELGVEPGQCSWAMWRFDPGAEVAMHYTDTFDFQAVLEGALELLLDDGVHLLRPGDCVVMTGVNHAWRAGAGGCTVIALAFGTAPAGA
jgi:quercetin dioxygenase-like cupin family protein